MLMFCTSGNHKEIEKKLKKLILYQRIVFFSPKTHLSSNSATFMHMPPFQTACLSNTSIHPHPSTCPRCVDSVATVHAD